MIITVRGTNANHNKAAHVTAALAGMSSVRKSRKSLILQFCKNVPVEDLLVGKKKAETDIREIGFMYEDTGIDALFRRIETMRVTKEHFDACCTPILNADNMLDVAVMSRKEGFEEEILDKVDDIGALLNQAKEIYDDVFIYANAQNHKLMEALNQYSDLSIICIRQGIQEQVEEIPGKFFYLVTSYDYNSTFNVRYLRNLYKVKEISALPYSVEFKDACNLGTLMQFLGKNENIGKQDVTYLFISALDEILNTYFENKTPEEKEFPALEDAKTPVIKKEIDKEYEEPDVEVRTKKRAFSKKTKKVVKDLNGEIQPKMTHAELKAQKRALKDGTKKNNRKGKEPIATEEDTAAEEDAFAEDISASKHAKHKKSKNCRHAEPVRTIKEEEQEDYLQEDTTEEYIEEPCEVEYQEEDPYEDMEISYIEEQVEEDQDEEDNCSCDEREIEESKETGEEFAEDIGLETGEALASAKMKNAQPQKGVKISQPVSQGAASGESLTASWQCKVCGKRNMENTCLVCGSKRPGYIR